MFLLNLVERLYQCYVVTKRCDLPQLGCEESRLSLDLLPIISFHVIFVVNVLTSNELLLIMDNIAELKD